MLSKAIQDAMNEQIKNELYSAHQYLSMSAYCESATLPGFAHWMLTQAQEEREHAMKFYNFILDRDGLNRYCAVGFWRGRSLVVLAAQGNFIQPRSVARTACRSRASLSTSPSSTSSRTA